MPRIQEIGPLVASATSGTAQVTGLAVEPVGRPGDLWLAAYLTVGGDPGAHTPPANHGWEPIADSTLINATLKLSVWRKRNYVSAPVAFTHTGSLRAALAVRAFGGTEGIEGTPAVVPGVGVQSITHTAHTALGPDRVWVLVTGKNVAGGAQSTFDPITGFTETADLCSAHSTNPNANLGIAFKPVGAGSTGTQVVDASDSVNQTWAGIGFLLKPQSLGLPPSLHERRNMERPRNMRRPR